MKTISSFQNPDGKIKVVSHFGWILFIITITTVCKAEEVVIEPLKERNLQIFKKNAGQDFAKYFTPAKKGDDSYDELYFADVNHDGSKDYILVHCYEGKDRVDRIVEVFSDKSKTLIPLHIHEAIGKKLSEHKWFYDPFLVTEDTGVTFLQFTDHKKDYRYQWKNNELILIGEKFVKQKIWKEPKQPVTQ